MTLRELRALCERQAEAGETFVALILPGQGRGLKRHLCKTRGPLGDVVLVNREGNSVCSFQVAAVMKWLDTIDPVRKALR